MRTKMHFLLGLLVFLSATAVFAQGEADLARGLGFIAMGLAVAGSCIGAGYAVARVGAAGTAAIVENPKIMGRVLIFLGLAEGIAIYGVLIALIVWISL